MLEYNTPVPHAFDLSCGHAIFFGQGAEGFRGVTPSPSANSLCHPHAMAVDAAGNVYIADQVTTGCSSTTRR